MYRFSTSGKRARLLLVCAVTVLSNGCQNISLSQRSILISRNNISSCGSLQFKRYRLFQEFLDALYNLADSKTCSKSKSLRDCCSRRPACHHGVRPNSSLFQRNCANNGIDCEMFGTTLPFTSQECNIQLKKLYIQTTVCLPMAANCVKSKKLC